MKKIVSVLIVLSVFAAIGIAAAAEERKLEIIHWWVGPGEREAADEWFKALKAKYPDIEVIENPV
ncbi:MAG: hypothetical protein ABSB63_22650, partial [Spirochaetia bacterium]